MKDITGHSSENVPSDWLTSTTYVDYENGNVKAFADRALQGLETATDTEKAIRLFTAVRDDIRYDPYQINFVADGYKASHVADLDAAFCVPKAILLTACLRYVGIPAGMGFADVKNHLNSAKLSALMKTDMFVYHGYVALRLGNKTFKVTPTFNKELCDRFGVRAIEFDGTEDALFHEYDAEKRKHMEYVKDRGIFLDPPMDDILEDLGNIYSRLKELRDQERQADYDPEFAA